MTRHWLAIVMLCAAFGSARAGAQQIADDAPERARIQLGPVGVTPSVALTRFGIDTNVFNEVETPKRDLTLTLSPQVDAWTRAGRSRVHVAARTDFVYFQRYTTERSVDGAVAGRFEVRGNRLTPWVSGSYLSTRQRIGYEVDLRFRRRVDEVAGGVETRVGGRTRIDLAIQRGVYAHDPDAVFLTSNLREVLDRRSNSVGVQMRYALTPLTTFVLSGQTSRDRFPFTPTRDSESVRFDTGFDLAPSALISGRGRVGYRRLLGVGGDLAQYSGLVASVAAGSTIAGRTRIDVTAERDVTYSWEPDYPYYLLTGATVTGTPRLTERWDLQGRLGRYRLAYQAVTGATHLLTNRVDSYSVLGAGVGFHVGRDLRLGFNLDRERRTSPVHRRLFEGYRAGISVTYGR